MYIKIKDKDLMKIINENIKAKETILTLDGIESHLREKCNELQAKYNRSEDYIKALETNKNIGDKKDV